MAELGCATLKLSSATHVLVSYLFLDKRVIAFQWLPTQFQVLGTMRLWKMVISSRNLENSGHWQKRITNKDFNGCSNENCNTIHYVDSNISDQVTRWDQIE